MNLFEDKTIKPNRSGFWIFAPIVTLAIVILLVIYASSGSDFSWRPIFVATAALVILLIIWKIVVYFNSNSKEVREYEKKMKKIGRR